VSQESPRVVIGMDPHKRSVTIEVMDGDEHVLGGGRFATDAAGYRSMLDSVRAWCRDAGLMPPQRTRYARTVPVDRPSSRAVGLAALPARSRTQI
jgi:hypothetical protein